MQLGSVSVFALASIVTLFGSACVIKPQYDQAVRDASQAKEALAKHTETCSERIRSDDARIQQLSGSLTAADQGAQEREQRLSETAVANHNLQAKLDESVAMNQQLRNELSRLGKNVDQLLSEKGALMQSVNDMKSRLEALRRAEQAAEVRAATQQRLALQFKPLTDAGFLTVAIRDNRVVLIVSNDKLFDGAKNELRPSTGDALLKQIAIVLKTYPDRRFQVGAHNEGTGKTHSPTSWDGCAARANEVVRRLVHHGVRTEALSAASYAESDPIAPNDTPQNRAKNRRIEVVFVPKTDELAAAAPETATKPAASAATIR